MWYDEGGVFTGSATVLNDPNQTPMLSYSVSTNNMQCIAFPTNRSDPNLVEWTKSPYNPIINSNNGAPEGRDDTTAWLSADGSAWLMAYGVVNGAILFQAPTSNITDWSQVGFLYSVPTGQWEVCVRGRGMLLMMMAVMMMMMMMLLLCKFISRSKLCIF
jgi:sucrose-6-phosphate hydrolase SacC (GH32 family)